MGLKRLINIWFSLDLVLALFPPLYWAASGRSPQVLGLPLSVTYFLVVGAFISASIVVAFMAETRSGTL